MSVGRRACEGRGEGGTTPPFTRFPTPHPPHRDKDTGTSRGFAFLAYEDQRSTVVAVDNLSGTRVWGRTLRVEHVDDYRIKLAELDPGGAGAMTTPPPARTEADAAAAAAEAAGAAYVPEAEASVRGCGDRNAAGGGGGDAPWADSGSVFALLRSTEAVPAAGRQAAAEDADKEARRRRRKEEKRERRRKRSRSPRRRE